MKPSYKDRIDSILEDMENGQLSIESSLESCRSEQPTMLDYLFQEEHDFLTSNEKNQLIFLFSVLWELKNVNLVILTESMEELEEALWIENEADNFPYSSAHPDIERTHDEVFAFIIDCADAEINDITSVGAEWIMIKGFVLAAHLIKPSE